jgi:hypothetical protein
MTTHDDSTANNPADQGGENSESFSKTDNEVVPRSAHRKLLDEKKKSDRETAELRARLDELEAERKSAEETKLVEQNRFKELAEQREKELLKKEQEIKKRDEILAAQQSERKAERKRAEVLEQLGAKFKKPQYEKFLEIDEVPDDAEERKNWVSQFKADNMELLVIANTTPPPGTAPRSGGSSLPVKPAKNVAELMGQLNEFNENIYKRHMAKSATDFFNK